MSTPTRECRARHKCMQEMHVNVDNVTSEIMLKHARDILATLCCKLKCK